MAEKLIRCSFCGKTQAQVKRIMSGPNAYICNECIEICKDLLDEERAEEALRKTKEDLAKARDRGRQVAEEGQRLLAADSSYYFRMAPYAMALGVLHPFTQAFGKRKLPQCPYIVTRVHGSRKAEDWETLLKDLTSRMDARAKRMEMDRWLAVRFR